jgi:hypothetical protein
MSILWVLAFLAAVFVAAAFYYAVKFTNGKVFPSRRDKLLRKTGPLASAKLEDANLRFFVETGGRKRVTLNAVYRYEVKDSSYTITLPIDSSKLSGPEITAAVTRREVIAEDAERSFPESLTLEDGTRLDGRETIRQHYLERLRNQRPEVEVLYDKHSPALSTVRDWR